MRHITKRWMVIWFVTGLFYAAYSQSDGEQLFRLNRPEAAIPLLEQEIEKPGVDPVVYIYLGLSYYQTGQYADSISVFEKGMRVPGADLYTLSLDAGNSAFALKNYDQACTYYTEAVKQRPDRGTPVLNRANARLKQDKLGDALADYKKFVEMSSQDPQLENILQLTTLLEKEIEKRKQEAEKKMAQTEPVSSEDSSPDVESVFAVVSEPVHSQDSTLSMGKKGTTVPELIQTSDVQPDIDPDVPVKSESVSRTTDSLPVAEKKTAEAEQISSSDIGKIVISVEKIVPEPVKVQPLPDDQSSQTAAD